MQGSTVPTTLTTTALLRDLMKPANSPIWEEFDARYRPILIGTARKIGLNAVEAEEVAQDTLACFVENYRAGKYDRDRGRLRSWILGIARNRIAELHRSRARRREHRGDSALVNVPNESELDQLWITERRAQLVKRALRTIRETSNLEDRTIRAFEAFANSEQTAAEVGRDLGMTAADVYMAKNRVARRLRDILSQLESTYDDG